MRRRQAATRARAIVETMDGVKIFLLGGSDFDGLMRRRRFEGLFDSMVLSSWAAHHMASEDLNAVLASDADIHVETAKYIVPFGAEEQEEYVEKVQEMANGLNWTQCGNQSVETDYLSFSKSG